MVLLQDYSLCAAGSVLIKHAKVATTFLEVINLLCDGLRAIVWSEFNLHLAWLGHHVVLAPVLVTKCVSANDDWLGPSGHKSRDI